LVNYQKLKVPVVYCSLILMLMSTITIKFQKTLKTEFHNEVIRTVEKKSIFEAPSTLKDKESLPTITPGNNNIYVPQYQEVDINGPVNLKLPKVAQNIQWQGEYFEWTKIVPSFGKQMHINTQLPVFPVILEKNQKPIEIPANIPLPPPLFKNDKPKPELTLPPIDTSTLLERDTTPLPFKIPTFTEPEPHRVLPLKTATFRELETTSVLITPKTDVTHTGTSIMDTIEVVDKRKLKKKVTTNENL